MPIKTFLRRWRSCQFTLKELLCLVFCIACLCLWVSDAIRRAQHRENAVAVLQRAGLTLSWYKTENRVGELKTHPYWAALHDVNNYSASPITKDTIFALRAFPELVNLELHSSDLNDDDLHCLRFFSDLRNLDLSSNPNISGLGLIRNLASNRIISLNLSKTGIADSRLQFLSKCNELRFLELEDCPITDRGLACISTMESLEHIYCNGTQITDDGIGQLSSLPNLSMLSVENTSIGNQGVRNCGALKHLHSLYLSNTKVTDEGLAHFILMRNLKILGLNGPIVTPFGVNRLQNARPDLKVFYEP